MVVGGDGGVWWRCVVVLRNQSFCDPGRVWSEG